MSSRIRFWFGNAKSAIIRRFRLDLLRSLLLRAPYALCRDFCFILRFVWQEHCNRRNPPDNVLLANFRTAAHILDKGLCCESWEPGRSRTAYARAMHLREQIDTRSAAAKDPSYRWAVDRIRAYELAQERGSSDEYGARPEPPSKETRELYINFLRSRRSVRCFARDAIPRETLEELAMVSQWAPCSCCRQPIILHIAESEEQVKSCLDQCAGATGFSEYVPCFVSVCVDTRFYSLVDRHLPLIDAALGVQSFVLAAHAHGIACTILNWMHATRREEGRLRSLLDISPHEKIVLNLAMGYPVVMPPEPGHKGLEQTCVFV